ncbi:unnamed protein product [Coregonus sp. 'balchen']|nr:unnamed protein product [Coregonus sp. 'balchen']
MQHGRGRGGGKGWAGGGEGEGEGGREDITGEGEGEGGGWGEGEEGRGGRGGEREGKRGGEGGRERKEREERGRGGERGGERGEREGGGEAPGGAREGGEGRRGERGRGNPAINGTVNGTVKVLPPSTEECEARNKKKKKTLVCVATGFYPDHVTVFWQVNDHNRTEGAGTDNKALQNDNKLYSITSRLRVPANEWHNPANRFTCNVIFYNEKGYKPGKDTISGDLQEYYVKSTLTAKLAYSVFIAKSTFYGLVVMVLIWKFKEMDALVIA